MRVESHVCKLNDSFVSGTNDGEVCPKHWVAALVQMNCEKKVAAKLDKLGIANYVPIQQKEHQWSDQKKKIDRGVIPMVIFVRLVPDGEDAFRRLAFIPKFITYPSSKELVTSIPDEQIESPQFLLHNADAKVSIVEYLKVGDKVRLVRGPLKGLEGKLVI